MSGPKVFEDNGAAELNVGVVAARVQSAGPVTLIVENQSTETGGPGAVVVAVKSLSTGLVISTDKDTTRTAEVTGYSGDGSDKSFSGQVLNNLPIVPGSLSVHPATGAVAPTLVDDLQDGMLYTDDDDHLFSGTINYFSGALTLEYPTSKSAPANGVAVHATYHSQDATLKPGGKRNYAISNVLQEDTVVVSVATNSAKGAFCKVNGIATWG